MQRDYPYAASFGRARAARSEYVVRSEVARFEALRREPGSLLNRLERMIRTRKEFPEFGTGTYRILETDRPKTIFAHACEDDAGSAVLAVHNLSNAAEKVSIRLWKNEFDHIVYLFEERETEPIIDEKIKLDLPPCGYSWLRLVHKV